MFNEKLQPIYNGKVLVNQSAMDNPIVQAALAEMSKRNFEPQRLTIMGFGTSETGTNYDPYRNNIIQRSGACTGVV